MLLTVGVLRKKPEWQSDSSTERTAQTREATLADNKTDTAESKVLQAKLEALEAVLKVKEEVLQIKDDQLRQAEARELFYQEELRTVRMLAAPLQREKKKRFFGLF